MAKRFSISYSSGTTGYGWHKETNDLRDMFQCVDGFRYKNSKGYEHSAHLTVWDNEKEDFIFWKDVLEFYPKTNKLNEYVSRYQKYYWRKQNELRQSAIDWQYKTFCHDDEEEDTDYYSLFEWAEHFRTYGKRFGLIEEFKENAII